MKNTDRNSSSYTFIYETEGFSSSSLGGYSTPPRTITFEVRTGELTVDNLCSCFQDFLKSAGFILDDGSIQFVPHDELAPTPDEPQITEEDISYDDRQSQFDFSAVADEVDNENVDTTGYEPTKDGQ